MPVKLKDSYTPDSIPVYDMKDGQIGVITEWGCSTDEIGWVVQRCYKDIIVIGRDRGFVFRKLCTLNNAGLRVRLLKRGELIEIQDN